MSASLVPTRMCGRAFIVECIAWGTCCSSGVGEKSRSWSAANAGKLTEVIRPATKVIFFRGIKCVASWIFKLTLKIYPKDVKANRSGVSRGQFRVSSYYHQHLSIIRTDPYGIAFALAYFQAG